MACGIGTIQSGNHEGFTSRVGKRFLFATCLGLTLCLSVSREANADPDDPPKVVSTTPAIGQSDVDPATTELVVVFDKDMARGFSWTGGGEAYPEVAAKPSWRSPRECVLPVKLAAGRFYRVGLNSTSHKNFQATNGHPLPPSALYFATSGADAATLAKLEVPKIVKLEPANNANGVPSSTTTMSVTFDRPMGAGASWTGVSEEKPKFVAAPVWSADKLTCTATVKMEPNRSYTLSLNSLQHINFSSEPGVPLAPAPWSFSTGK